MSNERKAQGALGEERTYDSVIEITRRDLIRSLVGLGAVFVLPGTAAAEGMRDRFGRIVIQASNLELNHLTKSIGIAELGMVNTYKQNAAVVGNCLSAWVHVIQPGDISLQTGFKNEVGREFIRIDNSQAFDAMKEIEAQYNTEFVPIVAGLSFAKSMTGKYPANLLVGARVYEVDDDTSQIWSYFPGEDHSDTAPRLDVKGSEFKYYTGGQLRMAAEVPDFLDMMHLDDSESWPPDGRKKVKHLMVLVSGGPDSATTVAEARKVWPTARITPLYLQFGHDQDSGELNALARLVETYQLETPEVVDMRGISAVLPGRVLIHSGAAIMPFGNAFVLTFALAYAARARIEEIWVGMHADDVRESHEYSREYFDRIQRLAYATSRELAPRIVTPFVDVDKVTLFRYGAKLGVDYGSTWSCIRGTDVHCGKCGACLARQRAFSLAGVRDTTEYAETLPLQAQAS